MRRLDLRSQAAIAALACLPLLPALLLSSRLALPAWSDYSDLLLIHWPKVELIRRSLSEGQGWPLWSPYALSGQPLAANQLAMLFYPPALLLLGPLPWAFSAFLSLHLAWGGAGVYWLVRGLGRGRSAALVAGAIFVLNGKLAAHGAIGHLSLVAAMAWLPWAIACLHRGLSRPSALYIVLAGACLAAQATTHTYVLIYTAYGLLAYALLFCLDRRLPWAKRLGGVARHMPRLALLPVAVALLGAAQLLPLAEMAQYSNRSLSLDEATLFSLSPIQTLAGLLLPTAAAGHEWIIYPGLLTWGLAAGAWRWRREQAVRAMALLTLGGVLLALGPHTPLYALAYRLLPGLAWLRTPARLWLFVSLGLAVLAAYGVETWQRGLSRGAATHVRRLLVAAAGLAVGLSLGMAFTLGGAGRGVWGLGVFGLLSCWLLWWSLRPNRRLSVAGLALVLVAGDLLSFDSTLVRFAPVERALAPGSEAISWLAQQSGLFRTYSPSYSLPQPAAAKAGLQQIDGVEPVHLADYDRFMALAGGYSEAGFSVTIPPFPEDVDVAQAHRNSQPSPRLLGMLNGQYVASEFPLRILGLDLASQQAQVWIYENQSALPRAFVVHQTEAVTHQQVWQRLETVEPAEVALVEWGRSPLRGGGATPAQVIEYSANHIVVHARLEAPGFLVLGEVWYPGWQAHDNGSDAPLHRTNAILRGVALEAGEHVVEFDYRPWTVRAGLVISGTATAAVLLGGGIALWRRR